MEAAPLASDDLAAAEELDKAFGAADAQARAEAALEVASAATEAARKVCGTLDMSDGEHIYFHATKL